MRPAPRSQQIREHLEKISHNSKEAAQIAAHSTRDQDGNEASLPNKLVCLTGQVYYSPRSISQLNATLWMLVEFSRGLPNGKRWIIIKLFHWLDYWDIGVASVRAAMEELVKIFKKAKSRFYWFDFTVRDQRYRRSTGETKAVRATKVVSLLFLTLRYNV